MATGWRKSYLRYREFFLNITAIYKRNQDLRMFLEILLSLGAISFFTIFALKPTVLTIISLTKEIKTKEETVAKMDQKISNIASAQIIFASETARIPLTTFSVPDNPTPEALVGQIEGAALTNSLNLLGISVGQVVLVGEQKKEAVPEGIEPLPEGSSGLTFSVSVTGDYAGLSRFISELENLRRPIKIDSSGLTSSKTEEGSRLVLLVSGRVPYLKK